MRPKSLFSAALFSLLMTFAIGSAQAAVTGKALFEGAAPAAEKIKVDADPKCKMMHPAGLEASSVIVNSNGTLKNVFVYVKEGAQGKFETPKESVVFDQVGCEYKPKVFGIQVNQTLEILNSDDTLHNVHSLPTQSQGFNLGMPIKGMKLKKSFSKPEVMVKIKCEVHPWMAAYAGVLDHPFYSVTDDEGKFEIKNLPPGNYVLEAWHEKYGAQTQNMTVAEGEQETSFTFKP
ncbi:MAG: carboxypeptidase regulatory-like domain-containing protein [Candidatus Omnitrophica bacterium]|nr:carboxypeptidase regulatory-like domain-containing protein [Candidatus Omnitrophota bacterium]